VAIASLKASYCVNVEGLGDSPYTKTFLQIWNLLFPPCISK
jgi:hypothetical protein